MNRLLLTLLLSGCLTIDVAAGTSQFAISEVIPNPTSGDVIIELTNTGASSADIGGCNLCWQFAYTAMPAAMLPAGGQLRVHVGVGGTNTATDIFLSLALPQLDPGADSVALYKPGGGLFFFGVAANMIDFVQYGLGNQPRADVATSAGIWPSTTAFVSTPGAGVSLAWDGAGDSVADWFHDASPTLGLPNLSASAAALNVGPGCSAGPSAVLGVDSAVALGNLDLSLTLGSAPANKPGLLFVGLGTISVPVLVVCTFYVNTVPVGLEIPIATDGSGSFELPLLLDDPSFVGLELGLQAIVANDSSTPKFDMSSGLSLTF